jgi:hypothetical protein
VCLALSRLARIEEAVVFHVPRHPLNLCPVLAMHTRKLIKIQFDVNIADVIFVIILRWLLLFYFSLGLVK